MGSEASSDLLPSLRAHFPQVLQQQQEEGEPRMASSQSSSQATEGRWLGLSLRLQSARAEIVFYAVSAEVKKPGW